MKMWKPAEHMTCRWI